MPTPRTFSLPTASTAIAAVSDESMPPLSPISACGSRIADIIARAEDQRFIDGFAFVGQVGVLIALRRWRYRR